MRSELSHFHIGCDRCGAEETYSGSDQNRIPEGWGRGFHYCDEAYCTGHDEDLCPKHFAEYEEKRKESEAQIAEWKARRAQARALR